MPTAVVLVMLAAIAWLGNRHEWRLPRFSQLFSPVEQREPAWCDAHGVLESECIACNAELMPKGQLFGWCKVHGVHECVLEHPELAQLEPTAIIGAADLARAERAIALRPRTPNDPGCQMHLRRVQFPSIEAVDRAGIDIGLVDRGPIVETTPVTGEVIYDPTRVTHVSSRANGIITAAQFNVGDSVHAGDVLAIVDAADVGQAKAGLLEDLVRLDLAQKTHARIVALGGDVIPAKQIEQSESALAAAQVAVANSFQRLANLGLEVDVSTLVGRPVEDLRRSIQNLGIPETLREAAGGSSNLLPVTAPRDGVVVMRHAVAGEVIETGEPLYTVVDTSQMWLVLNVPLEETERASIGQKIVFRPDGSPNEAAGTVAWISTDVDPQTRTVQLRGHLDNRLGILRNKTYGSGHIVLREETDAILVPQDAIHWEGCCHVAFVRDKDYFKEGSYKVFHARSVRPGATVNGQVEVIAGLLPGEVVATKGAGILRAELLKGNLGAG